MNYTNSAQSGLDSTRSQAMPSSDRLVAWAFAAILLAIAHTSTQAQTTPAPTDVTFAFTSDVHVSFDMHDDHQGILDDISMGYPAMDALLITNETAPGDNNIFGHHDGCSGQDFSLEKDLCNQIQLVRKLNYLPSNRWSEASFLEPDGHSAHMQSEGQLIGDPKGVIIAGDLTECGAGSDDVNVFVGPAPWDWDSEHCDTSYKNGVLGEELQMFEQLFDKNAHPNTVSLDSLPIIQGLNNPDNDVPLHFPIYPHLGNHDLGYQESDKMRSYVGEWNTSPGSARHVTNKDIVSLAYSWDWGRLHIVNVGVFAGSSNFSAATTDNYAYSQEAMDWLINDLQTYASDGRPVIICQHFGFDSLSYSSKWYLDSAGIQGAQNIWAAIAPYNVIGIFAGHQHDQAFYSFHPNDSYAGPVLAPNTAPRLAYDMFEIGAGFLQDFAAVRVTDNFIDVQATADQSDFNDSGSAISWIPPDDKNGNPVNPTFFTKRLVQPPTAGKLVQVDAKMQTAASIVVQASQFVIGANSYGTYTVRAISPAGESSLASQGSLKIQPKFMVSYNQDNNGYLLVSDGSSLIDFQVTQQGALHPLWKDEYPVNSMAVVYGQSNTGSNNTPYLVADEGGSVAAKILYSIYMLSPTGMKFDVQKQVGGTDWPQAQLVALQSPNSEKFQLVHYSANGNVSFYFGAIAPPRRRRSGLPER